ncbi:hypothetical protein [Sphingomonas sp. Leaf4]|uniref:hypothetical protein n=1 Tax=Sphingomonas sp. Leaf4 TaxID=2876553 RepID=UPI001E55166B|nr:hypothetical protein [Sphingomonas sp. Leaf4]
MSDSNDIIKKAMQKRLSLQAELKKVENFLKMAEDYNGGALPNLLDTNEIIKRSEERLRNHIQNRRYSTDQVVEATKKVLSSAKRPMNRFELVEVLDDMNVRINGVDKAKNLGTILWRSPDFVSTPEGYWINENLPDKD